MSFPESPRPKPRKPDTSWRWWTGAFGLLALLWWLQPEYGFDTSESGEQVAPPLDEPDAELEPATPEAIVEAEPEQASTEQGLRGLCVGLETDEPLSGFTVRVVMNGEISAEAVSDDNGRFKLNGEFETGATIAVLEYPGWSGGLTARPLTFEELEENEGLVFRVPTATTETIRGRVTDARTGQALANLNVRLNDAINSELAVSDWAGRFTSELKYITGATSAVVFDRDSESPFGSFELTSEEESDRIELAVEIGPTIPFVAEALESETDRSWRARILEQRGDPSLSGRIAKSPSGWTLVDTAIDVEGRAWSWQTARPGPPTWIRYPSIEHEPTPEFSPVLQLQSGDGKRIGQSVLTSTIGVQSEPLSVAVLAKGSLTGTIRDSDSAPVSSARIWLQNRETETQSGPWQTSDSGSFAMKNLDVGSYELTIIAPSFPQVQQPIDLQAGVNQLPNVQLPFSTETHELRGRFECRLAHAEAIVLVELEAKHGHDKRRQILRRVRSQKVSNPSSFTSNEFAFTNLPAGTYTLRPIAISGKHRWQPDEATATTPVQPIRFRCAGDGSVADLLLEAVDADSGILVPGLELYFGPVKQPPFTWPESRPVERWYTLPIKSPLTWTAWAPGYQPSTGVLGDRDAGRNSKPLRVELKRGFGLKLDLLGIDEYAGGGSLDRSNASVLPGIVIRVDGERYGLTDENGELLLRLDQTPSRIDLIHPRWRVVQIEDRASDPGQLPAISVWLTPR